MATRTIQHTRRGKTNHRGASRTLNRTTQGRVAHDVERIIKRAMTQTAGFGLRKRIKDFVTDSFENAKDTTENLHEDVANYTYRKPYTTLGLALLTGAAIALVVNKSLTTNYRR